MADDRKINIYVNSRNKRKDETASNFNAIIPDGLLKLNSINTLVDLNKLAGETPSFIAMPFQFAKNRSHLPADIGSGPQRRSTRATWRMELGERAR